MKYHHIQYIVFYATDAKYYDRWCQRAFFKSINTPVVTKLLTIFVVISTNNSK